MNKETTMKRERQRDILEKLKKQLEEALALKAMGKDSEGDQMIHEIKEWMDHFIKEGSDSGTEKRELFDRSVFPQRGEMVANGNRLILTVINDTEKENYLNVAYEYSTMKGAYKDEGFREMTWKDFLSDDIFVCSVYDKKTMEYAGYCSINNLAKHDWEVGIELRPEFCNQGYGTEALSLLMQEVYHLTGKNSFCARVDIDNYPSQKLMKKLGARPNGIREYLLHGEDIERFKQEHKDMITDELRGVAVEFGMNAEDLLGCVLEYRFEI